ncbi:MAG: HipA domain-containing protein [Lachnospiraceae bacterium]|nr:HipA domain-containing protein [Lachnospiraceae bacterium]
MNYFIMRKNEPITIAEFSEDGNMLRYSQNHINSELAPLQSKSSTGWLKDWWKTRSIPISQGKVADMLAREGLLGPEDYLVKNLGLSLTDYFWIKPIGSGLTWEDVNLFDNDFSENLLLKIPEQSTLAASYAPNSTLQGQLEKTWAIDSDGNRILIKGNRDNLSSESINEVIASELHRLQGYDNYTPYELLRIKGKDYDYGCCSKLFTSQRLELVSAYAVVTSEKQSNGISSYEHFLSVCGRHGMDTKQLRQDMEYQIMTDFILSGRDRHLSNISILRDANTLEFLRMAPIYDSGKCLFVHSSIPASEKELLRIETQSFASSELKLLSYVTDRSLVDVSRLPEPDYIRSMYTKDSKQDPKHIDRIAEAYAKKVELFRAFQNGEDLKKRIIPGRR